MSEVDEELEALESIYSFDGSFSRAGPRRVVLKIRPADESLASSSKVPAALDLEFDLSDPYPAAPPAVAVVGEPSGDAAMLAALPEKLRAEAEKMLGSSMVYALVEHLRERWAELLTPEAPKSLWDHMHEARRSSPPAAAAEAAPAPSRTPPADAIKQPTQPKLTKAQKRRQQAKLDSKGELPRGHDWVDVISHLSKTGST
eukprot:m51a1_g8084 hypothetical protein (201) ;mRNA; r:30861-31671